MENNLQSLAKLLKDNGDLVLTGKAKVCLHLEELIYLTKYELKQSSPDEFVPVDYHSTHLNTILDFIQKTVAVKITGNDSVCGYISLEQFKSVKCLELYNVPVEIVSNVLFLKDRVRSLTLHRSCSDLCVFLVSDNSDTTWKHVTHANFCFNNISHINDSLSLMLPNIKNLDLSHNSIRDIGSALTPLKFLQTLRMSFNLLEDVPIIHSPIFQTLDLKNNNIKMLDGFYELRSLVNIDLSGNCLEYLEQLSPLSHFNKLEHLNLSGNPLSYSQLYRVSVLKELNHNINTDKLFLDKIAIGLTEYNYLSIPSSASRVSSAPAGFQTVDACNQSKPEQIVVRNSPKKRKIKSVKPSPIIADHVIHPDIVERENTDIARSMKEKYEDDWLSFFEGRDTNNIVLEVDTLQDLENITKEIDTFVESDEEEPVHEEKEETPEEVGVCPGITEPISDPVADEDTLDADMSNTETDHLNFSNHDSGEESLEGPDIDVKQHFASSDGIELFLSIGKKTIISERDDIGQLIQTLDINCLNNFIDEGDTLKLYFTHVLSARQFRSYQFNSNVELRLFLEEIEAIWRMVRDQNIDLQEVKCMNCDQTFNKVMVKDECAFCGSHMLTQINMEPDNKSEKPRLDLTTKCDIIPTSDLETNSMGKGSAVSSSYSSRTNYSVSSSKTMFINQNNFVTADHQLETFIELELFVRKNEVLCCYLFVQCSKYGRMNAVNSLLVVSNYMVYICRLTPPQKLTLRSRHRLTQLKYLDIGLNSQHFRLEWVSKEASYKFLVYDKDKCTTFINVLTLALPATTQISYISNSTISAIHELVFGIDRTFELVAKAKRYHHVLSSGSGKWGLFDRTIMFKTHPMCISGIEFVDWLLSDGECDSRAEAVDLCQQMLVIDIIHHVKYEEQFHDNTTLYRFAIDEEGYDPHHDYTVEENKNKDILCYQLCYMVESHQIKPISLILSNAMLFLSHEYHQWPLPRLQAPLPLEIRGQHFQVLHEIDLTDITILLTSELVLTISTQTRTYDIKFLSNKTLREIAQNISDAWELIFEFPLEVQDLPD